MRACLVLVLLALCGCQWGPPPRIPYVDGSTYVTPAGGRTELPGAAEYGVTAVAPYPLDGGLLVSDGRWFEGSVGLAHVVGSRRRELGPCATWRPRVGAGGRVAWLTSGCPEASVIAPTVLHVDSAEGGWTRELEHRSLLFVNGFVGDAVVVSGWSDPVRLVPRTGPVTVVPHLRRAVDAHGTLVAGDAQVVDTATGELLWHRPGAGLVAFSPSGRWLASYRAILDARTGAVVTELPGRLDRLTWEDDRHLLAVSRGGGFEVMVRIGLDGQAALISPVAPESAYRWTFETQP